MLRAIRFAARLDFLIEDATRTAIRHSADQVTIVSGERIAFEMQQTLQSSRANWAVAEWAELGLLQHILPEVYAHWSTAAETMSSLVSGLRDADWRAALAALLFAGSGPSRAPLASVKSRLKLANTDIAAMGFALESQPLLEQAHLLPWSQIQPCLIHQHLSLALKLLEARCNAGMSPEALDWIRRRLQSSQDLDPPPLLVGRDLIEMGLRPGPQFKQILSTARDLQLDEELHSREQSLAWAREQIQT